MIKELITDEEFLSQPSEPATIDDAALADDLVDTMKSLDNCACLAANQIGVLKSVIAYEHNGKFTVMFNPRIKQAIVPYKVVEACMSLNRETEVKRFRRATIAYDALEDGKLVPRQKKLTEWVAEIVQHAIDHTNGILV